VRSINHTLTATADFLQQFVIAEIRQHSCSMRIVFPVRRRLFIGNFSIPVSKQIKTSFEQAGGANSPCRAVRDFGPALVTRSKDAAHSWLASGAQYGNQMAQLIFNIARNHYRVGDLISQ
jgi:hypothetical protein